MYAYGDVKLSGVQHTHQKLLPQMRRCVCTLIYNRIIDGIDQLIDAHLEIVGGYNDRCHGQENCD